MTVPQVLSLAATALSMLACVKATTEAYMHTTCLSEDCSQFPGVIVFEMTDVGYAGALADDLQKQAANETGSLKPAHSYVPWITVNGVALGGAFEQLQIFICAAYLGDRYDCALRDGAHAVGMATC